GDGVATSTETTLREAINLANSTPGTDYIYFNIQTLGPTWTITPTSALPGINEAVVLDATTQPGYATHPVIEINGTSAGAGVTGPVYVLNSSGTLIGGTAAGAGNVVAGSGSYGIDVQENVAGTGGGNTIQGNYVGTNAAGTAALGNTAGGIVLDGSPNNIIG